ncbi:MAG: M20/M25/M40 family metallo-hydrolase [Deltaproteobacteria bacterium]|nr:M20/M25/M40 family metallo-hydrolase [Deltaproteobacteria bacterium]
MFDLIKEAQKLIAIRSDGDRGTMEIVRHLIPFCRQLGFHLTLQPALNGQAELEMNLIAHTVFEGSLDLCPGGLLWVTHLDTVPAGNLSLWTETSGDPFCPTLREDKIYGLGSADTKLDFLCKLKAIENVGLKQVKIPFALIGTFGEERALAGARLLHESGLIHPQFVLVGEPSEVQPVIAHKGILYMRAVWEAPPHPSPLPQGEREFKKQSFHGRAAHGSMPHLGESAIEKAVQWLLQEQKKNPRLHLQSISGGTVHNVVPEFCEIAISEGNGPCPRIAFLHSFFNLIHTADTYLETHSNPAFTPPKTTYNVGVIRGNTHRIEIEFDFRLIPETDGNALFEIFKGLALKIPEARVEVIRSNPPMATDPQSELVQKVSLALQTAGLPVRYLVKSGNTEGAIFNSMGAESVVIGPGKAVGNIHAPNEYNELSQLHQAVDFYTAFLRQFC